jgi:hypothetical protein
MPVYRARLAAVTVTGRGTKWRRGCAAAAAAAAVRQIATASPRHSLEQIRVRPFPRIVMLILRRPLLVSNPTPARSGRRRARSCAPDRARAQPSQR